MCDGPASPMQRTRLRELAALPEIGDAGMQWVTDEINKPLTCNQAWRMIQKLGKRIAEARA